MSATPAVIDENGSTTLSGDFTNTGLLDSHTVTIVWGDGSSDVLYPAVGARSFSLPHQYLDNLPGNAPYTISVTVTDVDGTASATGTTAIEVDNVAPSVSISGAPAGSPEGTPITVAAVVIDPGTLDVFTYAWTVTNNGNVYASANGTGSAFANFTFTPDDDTPTPYVVSLVVHDDDGAVSNTAQASINVVEVPPTIVLSGDPTVNEGSTYTLTLGPVVGPAGETARDPIQRVRILWGGGLPDTILDSTSGDDAALATLNSGGTITVSNYYPDGPGNPVVTQIQVNLTYKYDGVFVAAGVKPFSVINLPPFGSFANDGPYKAGDNGFVEWYNTEDPSPVDAASLRYAYDFNNNGVWDLGSGVYSGGVAQDSATVPASFLRTPGTVTVKSRTMDKDGGYFDQWTTITVLPSTFQVANFTTDASGFDVQFNRAAELSTLNLYQGDPSAAKAPDITVVGSTTGVVNGSMVWNASTNTMSFVKTGGVLAADTYTVTLVSGADAWQDTSGALLDGDGNNTPGGNFVTSFTVLPSTDRVVSIPDFARPGSGRQFSRHGHLFADPRR